MKYVWQFLKRIIGQWLLPGHPSPPPPPGQLYTPGQITQWIIVLMGIVARDNCTVCGCPDTGKGHMSDSSHGKVLYFVTLRWTWNEIYCLYLRNTFRGSGLSPHHRHLPESRKHRNRTTTWPQRSHWTYSCNTLILIRALFKCHFFIIYQSNACIQQSVLYVYLLFNS